MVGVPVKGLGHFGATSGHPKLREIPVTVCEGGFTEQLQDKVSSLKAERVSLHRVSDVGLSALRPAETPRWVSGLGPFGL